MPAAEPGADHADPRAGPLVPLAPRILYLAGHFMAPPFTAGSSRPLQLARRFVADGHRVTLLSTDAHLRSAGLTLADIPRAHLGGVEVVLTRSGYDNEMGFTRRKLEFAAQATKQAAIAVRGDHDLVYATSTPLTVLGPALARRRLRGTPFAFEVRDVWPEAAIELGALDHAWQQRAAHRLADLGYERSLHVITLSEGMRDMVLARGVDPAKVTVAHNAADPVAARWPVDSTSTQTARDPLAARAATDTGGPAAIAGWLAEADLATLYAGTIGRANDVGWLVDLVTHLDPALDLRLAIVGAGAEVPTVRAAIDRAPAHVRGRIAMFDRIPKGALLEVMTHVDLAFSTFADRPSLTTNSPNKVFDSWAMGVPVAINNDGWLADELDRHGAGIALPRDPAAAARDLGAWLARPGALATAAATARQRVRDEYNWDAKYRAIRAALVAALRQQR